MCTWQRFMCAQLPDGDNEGVQALALALGVELSQDDGVVRRLPNCNGSRTQHRNTVRHTHTLSLSSEITSLHHALENQTDPTGCHPNHTDL